MPALPHYPSPNAQALVPKPDKRIIIGGRQLPLRIQTAMLRD